MYIESFELEETFKGHLLQLPYNEWSFEKYGELISHTEYSKSAKKHCRHAYLRTILHPAVDLVSHCIFSVFFEHRKETTLNFSKTSTNLFQANKTTPHFQPNCKVSLLIWNTDN